MKTNALLALCAAVLVLSAGGCGKPAAKNKTELNSRASASTSEVAPATSPTTFGTGIMIVIDLSGSMENKVKGENGEYVAKIQIARTCLAKLLDKIADFSSQHPEKNIQVGICGFSGEAEDILEVGPLDLAQAKASGSKISIGFGGGGGTAIGTAIAHAKKSLNATGLTGSHILVITDGENNAGESPDVIVAAIGQLPTEQQSSVYLIGFDVDAQVFAPVKDAGAMVFSAQDEKELTTVSDFVLSRKILAEAE